MVGASNITAVKEKVEELQNSSGAEKVVGIAEKLFGKENISLQENADDALDLKDTTNKNFIEKRKLLAQTADEAKSTSWWKKGLTAVVVGGFGVLVGKEILGNKKEQKEVAEKTAEVTGEVLNTLTDEEELEDTNDAYHSAIELKRETADINEQINEKFHFDTSKEGTPWYLDKEKRDEKKTKYEKYGWIDASKDAWEKTEFSVDKEGNKTKRNFFFRLFAFFPAFTQTMASWKTFEKMKDSGLIEKIEKGEARKQEIEARLDDAEAKMNSGLEAKREGFEAIFAENPGALAISKNYFKQLANLTKNADKYSSPERADLIRKYAKDAATKGTKQFGPEFAKMKGFQKHLPGVSIKQRGSFMLVEIVGKSLGAALREGSEEGGWSRATEIFKNELTDSNNWKDACPIWGTIRSAKRLSHEDESPQWSKWLDFGLSAGMDVASIVGIVASFGSATPAILAARSAGGAAARTGVRNIGMKQVMRQSVKGGESFFKKALGKQSRKSFGNQAVRTAGGKWAFRLNLMTTTIGEFFGEDIDASLAEGRDQAEKILIDNGLSIQQRRLLALREADKTGGALPPRDYAAFLTQEDKKNKKEIHKKEQKENAGIFTPTEKEELLDDSESEKVSPQKNEKKLKKNEKKNTENVVVEIIKKQLK